MNEQTVAKPILDTNTNLQTYLFVHIRNVAHGSKIGLFLDNRVAVCGFDLRVKEFGNPFAAKLSKLYRNFLEEWIEIDFVQEIFFVKRQGTSPRSKHPSFCILIKRMQCNVFFVSYIAGAVFFLECLEILVLGQPFLGD